MNDKQHINEILNECIDKIASGQTLSDCTAAYPEHEEELVALLEIVVLTHETASGTRPSSYAKKQGLRRLNEALDDKLARRPTLTQWFEWCSPMTRPIFASVFAIVVMIFTATGANIMASDSVPGDVLYWVKISRENVGSFVPQSDVSKAQRQVRLADKRAHEIALLMEKGNFVEAGEHTLKINRHLNQSAQLVGLRMSTNPIELPSRTIPANSIKDLADLKTQLRKNKTISSALLSSYPWSAPIGERQMVRDMIRRNNVIYAAMIASLENETAGAWPPFYRMEPSRYRGR